jgi:translation initiation factor IF-3
MIMVLGPTKKKAEAKAAERRQRAADAKAAEGGADGDATAEQATTADTASAGR